MAGPASAAPLVTVIVPVYNGLLYIVDAIRSITAQTYPNLEVIVVDDGSCDESGRALADLDDGRVRYVHQPNAGTAAARNRGAALASGDCLAFLDQDDLWLPGKLAVQMAALAANPSLDLVLGHVWQGAFPAGATAEGLLAGHPGRCLAGYLPSTLLVRREVFARVGGFMEGHALAESFDWFVRARDLKLQEHMLPEIVAIRRIHGANKGRTQRHARPEYARVLKQSLDRRRSGTGVAQPRA